MTDEPLFPETLRIGPHEYTVNPPGWRLPANLMGYCDRSKNEIVVDDTMPPLRRAETYLHEVLHGVWNAMGLNDEVDEETAVNCLSIGLLSFLRDNEEGLRPVYEAFSSINKRDLEAKMHVMGTFG